MAGLKTIITGPPKAKPVVLPPAPSPAAPTPGVDDEALQAARRRELAKQAQRSGRMSTILSQDDKLGG